MPSHTHRSPLSPRALTRRAVLRAATAASAGLGLGRLGTGPVAGAQEPAAVTLALDWYPNANHAGIYMALDRGYFTEAGLDLEVYTPADPTTVLQTVGAGRDTFGISYHAEVLYARAQDIPVISIAAMVQHPLNSLMVLADSSVESPGDLRGMSVAVSGVPSDEAFLDTMLQTDGAGIGDVETINVGYDLLPAVLSGRADAVLGVYWTHETILAEREGNPVRYFRVEEWGVPDYYELVLVAGESVITEREDTVRGLLGAMQRGYADAIAEPDAAIELLVAASPDLDIEVEREGIGLLAPLWTDNGAIPFGTQTADRWQSLAAWLTERDLLAGEVDIATAWRGDLLSSTDVSPAASPMATPPT